MLYLIFPEVLAEPSNLRILSKGKSLSEFMYSKSVAGQISHLQDVRGITQI